MDTITLALVDKATATLVGVACGAPGRVVEAADGLHTAGHPDVCGYVAVRLCSVGATDVRTVMDALTDALPGTVMAGFTITRDGHTVPIDDVPADVALVARMLACSANRDYETAHTLFRAYVDADPTRCAAILAYLATEAHNRVHG